METRFQLAIEHEAVNISKIYGISKNVAVIIMLKGVTTYQDDILYNKK